MPVFLIILGFFQTGIFLDMKFNSDFVLYFYSEAKRFEIKQSGWE